nr:titin-like isoform X2 [Helicoverpa armigera]
MKYLLLSISILWIGLQWTSGHSLSKLELKTPSDQVYTVQENQDGSALTVSGPKLKKSSLREIIYYHIIERPFGDAEDSNNEAGQTDDDPKLDVRGTRTENDPSEIVTEMTPEEAAENDTQNSVNFPGERSRRKREVPEKHEDSPEESNEPRRNFTNGQGYQFLPPDEDEDNDTQYDGVKNRRKRDILEKDKAPEENKRVKRRSRYGRHPSRGPRVSRPRLDRLPKYIEKLLSATEKTVTEKPVTVESSTVINSFKDKADGNVSSDAKKDIKTYGVDLNGKGGSVWNNLNDPPVYFHVGYGDSNEDSASGSTSNEDSASISTDISSGSIQVDFNSDSSESAAHSGGESGSDENSGSYLVNSEEVPDTSNSDESNGDDDKSGINSGESGDVSSSVSDIDSGVLYSESIEDNGGSNEGISTGDLFVKPIRGSDESKSGSDESGRVSGESGSGSYESGSEENGGDNLIIGEVTKEPPTDIVKKFDQILTDLHNIFVKGNASLAIPQKVEDKTIDVNSVINSIFGEPKNKTEILRPGIEDKDPKNPNMVNVLEGLFTNIIKNNIVINNPPADLANKLEDINAEKDKTDKSEKDKVSTEKPNDNKHKPAVTESHKEKDTEKPKHEEIKHTTEKPKQIKAERPVTKKPNDVSSIEKPTEMIPDDIAPKKDEFDDENPKEPKAEHDKNDKVHKKEKIHEESQRPEHKEPDEKHYSKEEVDHEFKTTTKKPILKEKDIEKPLEDKTEKPEDDTKVPVEKPKEEKCPVQNNKDNKETESNTKLDYMMDLINNEKFWSFMGDLGTKYIASLSERTTKFIKEEIAAQVKKYFDEHKPVTEKVPTIAEITPTINTEKDTEISKPEHLKNVHEILEKDDKKPIKDKIVEPKHDEIDTQLEKSRKDAPMNTTSVHVKAKTVYGNTVGNDKVTNVYIFYANKNMDDIMNNIKTLVNGNNSTNIFTFGVNKPGHDVHKNTVDKKPHENEFHKPTEFPKVTHKEPSIDIDEPENHRVEHGKRPHPGINIDKDKDTADEKTHNEKYKPTESPNISSKVTEPTNDSEEPVENKTEPDVFDDLAKKHRPRPGKRPHNHEKHKTTKSPVEIVTEPNVVPEKHRPRPNKRPHNHDKHKPTELPKITETVTEPAINNEVPEESKTEPSINVNLPEENKEPGVNTEEPIENETEPSISVTESSTETTTQVHEETIPSVEEPVTDANSNKDKNNSGLEITTDNSILEITTEHTSNENDNGLEVTTESDQVTTNEQPNDITENPTDITPTFEDITEPNDVVTEAENKITTDSNLDKEKDKEVTEQPTTVNEEVPVTEPKPATEIAPEVVTDSSEGKGLLEGNSSENNEPKVPDASVEKTGNSGEKDITKDEPKKDSSEKKEISKEKDSSTEKSGENKDTNTENQPILPENNVSAEKKDSSVEKPTDNDVSTGKDALIEDKKPLVENKDKPTEEKPTSGELPTENKGDSDEKKDSSTEKKEPLDENKDKPIDEKTTSVEIPAINKEVSNEVKPTSTEDANDADKKKDVSTENKDTTEKNATSVEEPVKKHESGENKNISAEKTDTPVEKTDTSTEIKNGSQEKNASAEKKVDSAENKIDSAEKKDVSAEKKDTSTENKEAEKKDNPAIDNNASVEKKVDSGEKKVDSSEKKVDSSEKKDISTEKKDDVVSKDASTEKKDDSTEKKNSSAEKKEGSAEKKDTSAKKSGSNEKKDTVDNLDTPIDSKNSTTEVKDASTENKGKDDSIKNDNIDKSTEKDANVDSKEATVDSKEATVDSKNVSTENAESTTEKVDSDVTTDAAVDKNDA